jgi:hypothetical protein
MDMNRKYLCLVLIVTLGLVLTPTTASVKAANEDSYTYGYWDGSNTYRNGELKIAFQTSLDGHK